MERLSQKLACSSSNSRRFSSAAGAGVGERALVGQPPMQPAAGVQGGRRRCRRRRASCEGG